MKRQITTLALLAVGAGALFASTQEARTLGQDNQDLEARVAELEESVAKFQEMLDAAASEVNAVRAETDQIQRYLMAQAKAAKAMEKVLADSEDRGFTYGINPESREVLLAGWRSALSERQRDVPGTPEKPEPKPKTAGTR